MAKEIDKIIQSKTAPKSNNVLWDDGENLKINRNGKWESTNKQKWNIIPYPDLSTQPGILPYRFMGNYVIEQLIPITSSNIDENLTKKERIFLNEKLMYSNPLILDAALTTPTIGYFPIEISYDGYGEKVVVECGINIQSWWQSYVMEGKPLFVRLIYTTLEQDSSYEY